MDTNDYIFYGCLAMNGCVAACIWLFAVSDSFLAYLM
jgi:hypothetical protein